ncbi:MAG: HAD family hydrolase [Candidatus Bathyarchaeia archaeon]
MAVRSVVFDLDGTLVEFNLDFKSVRAEVKQFLVNQGFPASIFSINESIFEMLKKARVYLMNNGKTEKAFAAIQKHVLSIAGEHELKAARETSILPGVFETLKTLKKRGFKLAVFTINSKKSTEFILDKFRLRQFFDAVVTRDDVADVKPDPSHLAAALEAVNVDADEAIVVGDNVVDIKSAKALNTTAVGIISKSEISEKLSHAGAMQVITSITDLLPLISRLNEGNH